MAVTRATLLATWLVAAAAQPFTINSAPFAPVLLEERQRMADNYTGFVFNFNGAAASDLTPNGMLQPNQANTNSFLSTLPGDGNGQTLVTLGPCASNTPHTHPRGSEISFLLYGNIQFGMIEENAGMGRLILENITANSTVHVPTGILHFSHNPNCQPAAFLANFATKDPGTQTIWNSLFSVPTDILNAASGLSEANINAIKSLPFVTAPGTGGEECLKRCGLNFQTSNNLTAHAGAPAPAPGVSISTAG